MTGRHQSAVSASEMTTRSYDASAVVVLSGVEAIRKRPAMYIGSTGVDGAHRLIFELVENAIDEFLAGYCRNVTVTLDSGVSCSVIDDGRGLPIDLHLGEGRPALEVLLTRLHSGSKFTEGAYRLSGGLHGIGLTCVNALTAALRVDVYKGGRHYRQEYRQGQPSTELQEVGGSDRTGTEIHFCLDPATFDADVAFSYEEIAERLRDYACHNSGLTLILADPSRSGGTVAFSSEDGIRSLLAEINGGRRVLHSESIHIAQHCNGVDVEVAVQWSEDVSNIVRSYVNGIRTSGGGSHVDGLQSGLRMAIQEIFDLQDYKNGQGSIALTTEDIVEGMSAIVSVYLREPEFDSQIKFRLASKWVMGIVRNAVAAEVRRLSVQQPDLIGCLLARAIRAFGARVASRRSAIRYAYVRRPSEVPIEEYKKQFGIRSRNWHQSCMWLSDDELLKAHADLCAVPRTSRLVDVCCGSGLVGNAFSGRVAEKVGLDITPEMRAMAAERLDRVIAGSVYSMPFKDREFDIAVTREVLHLLPNVQVPLGEIFRVLRPGGQFIFGQTVPYGAVDAVWMFRIFKKKQPLFYNHFLKEDYIGELEKAGFVDVETKEICRTESIDLWIDTHETPPLFRTEIRSLFYSAPAAVRDVHPFEITSGGKIFDQWRWCIFSAWKP